MWSSVIHADGNPAYSCIGNVGFQHVYIPMTVRVVQAEQENGENGGKTMHVEINDVWMQKVMVCGCRNGRDIMIQEGEKYTCPNCNAQVAFECVVVA